LYTGTRKPQREDDRGNDKSNAVDAARGREKEKPQHDDRTKSGVRKREKKKMERRK